MCRSLRFFSQHGKGSFTAANYFNSLKTKQQAVVSPVRCEKQRFCNDILYHNSTIFSSTRYSVFLKPFQSASTFSASVSAGVFNQRAHSSAMIFLSTPFAYHCVFDSLSFFSFGNPKIFKLYCSLYLITQKLLCPCSVILPFFTMVEAIRTRV